MAVATNRTQARKLVAAAVRAGNLEVVIGMLDAALGVAGTLEMLANRGALVHPETLTATASALRNGFEAPGWKAD